MADYRDAMRAAVEASRVAEAAMAKHRESMRAAQAVRVATGGHRAEPADAEGAGEGEAASPRGRPDAGHPTSLAQYFELGNDGSSSEEEEDEEVQKEEKPRPGAEDTDGPDEDKDEDEEEDHDEHEEHEIRE